MEAMHKFVRSSSLCYHAHTIWLFTRSDLKTIVWPSAMFALIVDMSSSAFQPQKTLETHRLLRLLSAMFWVWINLLPFSIQNQRQAGGIDEDLQNKPWRPLPSNRLTPESANRLMWMFYAVAVTVSIRTGGIAQCLTLIGLGYWYNELGGADTSYLVRNFINGCGYMCFLSGASEVILTQSFLVVGSVGQTWLLITGAVIITTIQSQDMADQLGDSVRDRKTVPLVMGDAVARWTIAIAVTFWSWLCPRFWHASLSGSLPTAMLALTVSGRFLLSRTAAADKVSFGLYNAWILSLFVMPLSRSS